MNYVTCKIRTEGNKSIFRFANEEVESDIIIVKNIVDYIDCVICKPEYPTNPADSQAVTVIINSYPFIFASDSCYRSSYKAFCFFSNLYHTIKNEVKNEN